MSAQPQEVASLATKQTQQKTNGVSIIYGRIEGTRKFEERTFTLIRLPAPDEYCMPSLVEVSSASRLGSKGEEWKGRVRIGGMPNNFTTKDGERVQSARNMITVIED